MEAPKTGVLGGMTRNEMVIYVFMAYVTASMVNISISKTVSDDIVKGTVSMNLIKPIDYRMSLIARAVGDMIYQFLLPGVFIWIGLEIYRVQVLGEEMVNITILLCYLISVAMSFLIYVLFDFCFGMIAFFYYLHIWYDHGEKCYFKLFDRAVDSLVFFPGGSAEGL